MRGSCLILLINLRAHHFRVHGVPNVGQNLGLEITVFRIVNIIGGFHTDEQEHHFDL